MTNENGQTTPKISENVIRKCETEIPIETERKQDSTILDEFTAKFPLGESETFLIWSCIECHHVFFDETLYCPICELEDYKLPTVKRPVSSRTINDFVTIIKENFNFLKESQIRKIRKSKENEREIALISRKTKEMNVTLFKTKKEVEMSLTENEEQKKMIANLREEKTRLDEIIVKIEKKCKLLESANVEILEEKIDLKTKNTLQAREIVFLRQKMKAKCFQKEKERNRTFHKLNETIQNGLGKLFYDSKWAQSFSALYKVGSNKPITLTEENTDDKIEKYSSALRKLSFLKENCLRIKGDFRWIYGAFMQRELRNKNWIFIILMLIFTIVFVKFSPFNVENPC